MRGLESRGLVERLPDPNDGRAQRVVLTQRGTTMLSAARTIIDAMEREWRASVDAEEYDTCQRVLRSLADNFGPAEYL